MGAILRPLNCICLAVAVLASAVLTTAVSTSERPFVVTFRRGVVSESVTTDSATIRAWLSVDPLDGGVPLATVPEIHLEWQVASSDTFSDGSVVAAGRIATSSIGHGGLRATVDVSGLAAGQTYFYRFKVLQPDGVFSQTDSFATAAPTDTTAAATTAATEQPQPHPLVRRLTAADPDAVVVGTLAAPLSVDPAALLLREVPLGDLVCDAMTWFVRNQTRGVFFPTVCLFNSGHLSPPGLPAGPVTFGDVKAALPYADTIVLKEMTGLAILSALENALLGDWPATGGSAAAFLQISGLRLSFNGGLPPQQRVRTLDVRIRNGTLLPVDPCAKYLVATTASLAAGADGFASVAAARRVEYGTSLFNVTMALATYINVTSPVNRYNYTAGRINRCYPAAAPPPPGIRISSLCVQPTPSPPFGGCPTDLTLLHYNDLHGRLEGAQATGAICKEANEAAGVCFGGVARMATAVASARASAPNPVLLLDAGDMSTGTEWDLAYPDRTPSALNQNALGLAAFTLGNHEFDNGVASLVSYISQLDMPVLGCNVDAAAAAPELAALVKKYTVVELGGSGVRAGIVGWVIPTTGNTTLGAANITFLDVVPAVQAAVAELKAAYGDRLNIIIGLSHGGFASDVEVAAQVGEIDLIIGGHDHFFFYGDGMTAGPLLTATNPLSGQLPDYSYPVVVDSTAVPGKKVPVTQAYYASRYLGSLQLSFDAAGSLTAWSGQPLLLGGNASASAVDRDPATLDLIDMYGGALDDLNKAVIGYNPVLLSSDRSLVRAQESAIGNLVCDSIRWYLDQNPLLPAPGACLVNGGSIRADLAAGNLTTGDILRTVSYTNAAALIIVTGVQLLAALENGVSGQLTNLSQPLDGRFPQVSGLIFSYSPSAPAGQRVQSVALRRADGSLEPLDPCRTYTLATIDYVLSGGDSYTMFKSVPRVINYGTPTLEILREYVAAHSPLPSGTDGRIVRCSDSPAACPAARNVSDTCSPSPPPAPPSPRSPPPQRSPPKVKSPSPPPKVKSPSPPPKVKSPSPPPKVKSPSAPPKVKSPNPPPKSKPPSTPPKTKPPSPPPKTKPPSPPPKSKPPPKGRSPPPHAW